MVLYSGNLKNQNRVIRFKPCWHGVAVFRAAVLYNGFACKGQKVRVSQFQDEDFEILEFKRSDWRLVCISDTDSGFPGERWPEKQDHEKNTKLWRSRKSLLEKYPSQRDVLLRSAWNICKLQCSSNQNVSPSSIQGISFQSNNERTLSALGQWGLRVREFSNIPVETRVI